MILIPIKNTSGAKQRLASVLDQPSRTRLAQAMLHDVLSALHDWSDCPRVGLVTGDPFAIQLAKEYGFDLIPDAEDPGETAAIEIATRLCVEREEQDTLVIPADIPLVQAWELEEDLKARPCSGKRAGSRGRRARDKCCFSASTQSVSIAIWQ